MTLMSYLASLTSTERNNTTVALNGALSILFLIVLVLAVYLAIRDMGALPGTAPKMWLFIFALFMPELHVILHGLSSSSLGLNFFSASLISMPNVAMSAAKSPASAFSEDLERMSRHVRDGAEAALAASISATSSPLAP